MALLEVFESRVFRCADCHVIVGWDRYDIEQERGCQFSQASDGRHLFVGVDMSEIVFGSSRVYDPTPEWVASIWVDEFWPAEAV